MKPEIKFNLVLLLLLYSSLLFGQEPLEFRCGLNDENMRPVYVRVYENIRSLQQEGKLNINTDPNTNSLVPTAVRFHWPLRAKEHGKYTYYKIGNYTDLDTTLVLVNGEYVSSGAVKDYMGNSRTYDGHQGNDIGVGPYHWRDHQYENVEVIAAADGVIVESHDGEPDLNCDWDTWQGSTGRGNHVVILHNDGSTVSFYMHMRNGSVTERPVGSSIKAGELLGAVASSGRSTGPHLHFQINVGWAHPDSAKGKFVDPYAGPHNWTTDESLWVTQPPYDQPEIMGMETHSGDYSPYDPANYYTHACDTSVNISQLRNSFTAQPVKIGFRTFFRDWVSGGNRNMYILDPVGNLKLWWQVSNPNNWRFRYTYDTLRLESDPMVGTWTYNVSFNNKTYSHYFNVGCINDYNFSSSHSNNQGFIAGNIITSTATISGNSLNNVEYKADNSVVLNPGFTATAGCTFLASTDGCERGKYKLIR